MYVTSMRQDTRKGVVSPIVSTMPRTTARVIAIGNLDEISEAIKAACRIEGLQ